MEFTLEEQGENFDLDLITLESLWRRSLPTASQLRRMFGVVIARSDRPPGRFDKETVMERVDMATLYEMLHGKQLRRKSGRFIQAKCWKHEDRMPSLSLDTVKKRARCFSCGNRSSAIDCVMEVEGLNFYEALGWLGARF